MKQKRIDFPQPNDLRDIFESSRASDQMPADFMPATSTPLFETKTMMNETSSKSGRAFLLSCGILALCCSLDSFHDSRAAEAFRIFDVAIYLDRTPPCAATAIHSITVTVSPFKEQAYLADLVTELARRAAEVRANVIYAIKLISFIPNQGALTTATIAICPQSNQHPRGNLPPFNLELAGIVKRAPEARAYLFTDRAPALRRSVQASELRQGNLVGVDPMGRLRQLIFAADTYLPASDVIKPCPFAPSFGFEFSEGSGSAWWLVSETCRTAALVSRNEYWSEADTFDLQTEAFEAFRQLLETPKK